MAKDDGIRYGENGGLYNYEWDGDIYRLIVGKSWYYKNRYDHGLPWTKASSFANIFGTKYSTGSFYKFSKKVKKGSFIGFSRSGKKSKMTHMGFVVQTSKRIVKKDGVKFQDFKIAQHSRDYVRWAKHKKCGWRKVKKESPKAIFCIVK